MEAATPATECCWVYRCDGIIVDTCAHVVTRDGLPLPLEPKAFAVLVALLEHAGRLVDRDSLLDAVWGHRNVTPGALSRVIMKLRRALGDSAHCPRYIITVPCLGYRFAAGIRCEEMLFPARTPSHTMPPDGRELAPAPSPFEKRRNLIERRAPPLDQD